MRILSYMVARNEEKRYLDACLAWATEFFDGISLFDDRSDDYTRDLGLRHKVRTAIRPEGVPSFLEHEGNFRSAAWAWFEYSLLPEPGDWVVALDADEFLVAEEDPAMALRGLAKTAESAGASSVRLPVPEVFWVDKHDGMLITPQVRCDGYWGGIKGTRFFRYRAGGTFSDKAMGSGAEPTYVLREKVHEDSQGISLMHYGYADPQDVSAKYERYSSLLDHGHNNTHIQSIRQPPTLRPWPGPVPRVWRGADPYCSVADCPRPSTWFTDDDKPFCEEHGA